ncbi:carbamate kinase [Anopheles sinensis]|uniref:Carbamate kinase n=1 Tax=Anopheles sinensis TaxID=74873 RepID=A0A084VJ06_ANOSI|nr:carbamate kinase [Anopheles sinensis]
MGKTENKRVVRFPSVRAVETGFHPQECFGEAVTRYLGQVKIAKPTFDLPVASRGWGFSSEIKTGRSSIEAANRGSRAIVETPERYLIEKDTLEFRANAGTMLLYARSILDDNLQLENGCFDL